MVLLGKERVRNGLHHQPELLSKDRAVSGDLKVLVGQVQRRTEGVHLVLPLPNPCALEIAVVVLAVACLGLAVEGVGVGIQVDIKLILFQHAAKDLLQVRVLLGIGDIGPQLSGAVPQPHGGDIPGDDKIAAVLQLGDGGLYGV